MAARDNMILILAGEFVMGGTGTVVWQFGLDLSRCRAAPGARLGHLPFEGVGAFPAQCRVKTPRIVEAVDVFEDRHLGLPPCFP